MKKIIIGRDESRTIPLLLLGNENKPLQYDIILAEPGASVDLTALIIGRKKSSAFVTINVTHAAPHTTSNVNIKTVLTDKASAMIKGLATISPDCKGAKTWLAAHVVLLSSLAKGEATPSLEILENDVQAGHAATVGRVDEQELFYLMSRGLPRNHARQLIVQGFLEEVTTLLPQAMAERAREEVSKL